MKRIARETPSRAVAKTKVASGNGGLIQSVERRVIIAGKEHKASHESLIRMIRQVTQTIDEYNNQETPYAAYIINALRKARADMASDLEHYFRVHWRIDEETGKSVFYV